MRRFVFTLPNQSGRKDPTPDPIFRCLWIIDDKNLSVALILRDIGSVHPGETKKVPILFLDWEYARQFCSIGKVFLLREEHTIGEGVIEELRS